MWGVDPLQALLLPFRTKLDNVHTYTIFNDFADVVGIFGVMPTSKDVQHGRIWFLASDLLQKHYLDFLKKNKRWLSYLEEHYNFLGNYITCENKISINWLKWQGFNFAQQPTLVKGVKIMYFYKQLPSVTKQGVQPILEELGPIWTTELP